MKNVILITYSLFLFGLLSSCSPDPEVAEQQSNNAQNQLVNVRVEVVLEDPIHGLPTGASIFQNFLHINNCGLDGAVPSNVGDTVCSQTYAMAPGSNFFYHIIYWDYFTTQQQTVYQCNTVTLKIYSDNVLFHSESWELGGQDSDAGPLGSCADGTQITGNVIIPN